MRNPLRNQEALAQRDASLRRLRASGPALDVRELPSFGFSHRSLMWWGTQGLMAIEGMAFALGLGAWFYLRAQTDVWPPGDQPPALLWGSLTTLVLLVSLWPNHKAKQAAEHLDRGGVQRWLLVTLLVALAILLLRVFEFRHLNTHWQSSAYGSIVWLVLGLHTVHLLTDAYDSAVLLVLFHTGPLQGQRYVDQSENAVYWVFVVVSWLPVYAVLYLAPRTWGT
jgi:cytochrome c oxidase subunit I+III